MKKGILIIFFCLISSFGFAQESAGGGESLGGLPALNIGLFEENYVFPAYRTLPSPLDANQSNELKFQFSVKFIPFSWGNWSFLVAYTQKAFWQIYSADTSRPFRETNYNPEFLFRWKPGPFNFDIGYEHESNGESDPKSRSWDKLYMKFGLVGPKFKFGIKLWYIFLDELNGPDFEERNKPIKDYMGNGEIDLGIQMGEVILKTLGRYNPETGYGYVQTQLMWRFYGAMLCGFTHSRGYGDSLRSYNINHETYGFGFLMNP